MPLIGAIADDFTGATDLATMLVSRGFRTAVVIGTAEPAEPLDELDAVVVALKSRTAPVEEAVRDSLAALRALRAVGCERIYVKYCSTFDSTPTGNIGPVVDAVLDELGAGRAVVVPSFPATGRTVHRGHLFVGDQPLAESPMRDHPLTPMRDSDLLRLLAPQTRRPVRLIGHDVVRAGSDAVRDELAGSGSALVVVDAATDADLMTIAAATAEDPVLTGGAGLALGLTGPHPGSARAESAGPGPAVVLAGSASAATRGQVEHAKSLLPNRKLDVAALRADFEAAVAELIEFVRTRWEADPALPPMIYAVGAGDELEPAEGATPAGELLERALARCASELVVSRARRLLVAGGETSGAVVLALGATALHVGSQIAPGVPWCRTESHVDGEVRAVDVALKSGNFGGVDIFTTAWDVLS
ncbi:four-carbon acid sugar kinase family protein [Saccharopolyspora sp. NFXS83]|uniref:3-oxo-tetronate kinase n=1 Tax=Saccharopolyspora sp. NFXS83 TaxID=2993560 RepID=UPI00224AF928|nr:3-oxo-tetronate kinase [Saccharopolyspora sp. NFXS83]MCX2731876.1 four-carbon acid sugar kinase family protein [Saccharopolyspora sp. NFXS83]